MTVKKSKSAAKPVSAKVGNLIQYSPSEDDHSLNSQASHAAVVLSENEDGAVIKVFTETGDFIRKGVKI